MFTQFLYNIDGQGMHKLQGDTNKLIGPFQEISERLNADREQGIPEGSTDTKKELRSFIKEFETCCKENNMAVPELLTFMSGALLFKSQSKNISPGKKESIEESLACLTDQKTAIENGVNPEKCLSVLKPLLCSPESSSIKIAIEINQLEKNTAFSRTEILNQSQVFMNEYFNKSPGFHDGFESAKKSLEDVPFILKIYFPLKQSEGICPLVKAIVSGKEKSSSDIRKRFKTLLESRDWSHEDLQKGICRILNEQKQTPEQKKADLKRFNNAVCPSLKYIFPMARRLAMSLMNSASLGKTAPNNLKKPKQI
jgi:hypothetical protein